MKQLEEKKKGVDKCFTNFLKENNLLDNKFTLKEAEKMFNEIKEKFPNLKIDEVNALFKEAA